MYAFRARYHSFISPLLFLRGIPHSVFTMFEILISCTLLIGMILTLHHQFHFNDSWYKAKVTQCRLHLLRQTCVTTQENLIAIYVNKKIGFNAVGNTSYANTLSYPPYYLTVSVGPGKISFK